MKNGNWTIRTIANVVTIGAICVGAVSSFSYSQYQISDLRDHRKESEKKAERDREDLSEIKVGMGRLETRQESFKEDLREVKGGLNWIRNTMENDK